MTAGLTRADVLRADDVAQLTGLPRSTVYAYARSGYLPSRMRGKHRLFIRSEVVAWICEPDPQETR